MTDHDAAMLPAGRLVSRRDVVLAGHTSDRRVIEAAHDSPKPELRSAALRSALRAGYLEPEAVDRALGDSDPRVRRTALEVAATVRPARSIAALLDDVDDRVAEVAAFVLGELEPPENGSTAALSRLVAHHADSLVREAAVAAIGAIGDPDGLPAVLRACRDIAPIRRRAAIALAAYDDDAVDEQLRELLVDRDRHVRQIAGDLLD